MSRMSQIGTDGSVRHNGDMDMSDVMRSRRSALGLSQADLATAAGMSVRQIARYEAREQQPSLPGAVALADALDIPLAQLAGQQVDGLDLGGTWWSGWDTVKNGERRVALHPITATQRGERVLLDADHGRSPDVADGRYRWRGELRIWDDESLIGWYGATEPGVRSKGSLYFALNAQGLHGWGRWVGLSHDGLIVTGWASLARTEDHAARITRNLIETNGASHGNPA